MARARIPFDNSQESGWEPLTGASPAAINVIIDGKGAVRRRPCIQSIGFISLGNGPTIPCVGLHVVADGTMFAAYMEVTPGPLEIARVTTSDFAIVYGNDPHPAKYRPSFAETEGILVVANDTAPIKIVLSTRTGSLLGGSPPRSTHVVAHGSRLLMNNLDLKTQVNYSGLATGGSYLGHEQWEEGLETTLGLSGQFPVDARPDNVVALGTTTNEVFAFGATNVQVFGSDSRLIYAPSSTRDFGCAAPFAIISADNEFAWIDERRRVVVSDGRSFSVVSDPIKRTLDDMARVDDAFGYRVLVGPAEVLVFTFPTDGRTFAYQKGGGWAEWQGWSSATSNWQPFRVNAHCRNALTNEDLVGLTDGKIARLSLAANDDLGDVVPASVTTGYQSHDTDARKLCASLTLVLKRGTTSSATAPLGSVAWRDDGGPWMTPVQVDFGASGDTASVVQLRSLGVYRRRQWRFSFHGPGEYVLAGAEEEYTVLGS